MVYYAVVDRIERTEDGDIIVLEVEMIDFIESDPNDLDKETKMMDVDRSLFDDIGADVKTGDVFVVGHDTHKVYAIYYKDDEEKQRRI